MFNSTGQLNKPTPSPALKNALCFLGGESIRLIHTCSVTIPAPDFRLRQTWNKKEGNLTGKVRWAQRRPRKTSEGKKMKEGGAFAMV